MQAKILVLHPIKGEQAKDHTQHLEHAPDSGNGTHHPSMCGGRRCGMRAMAITQSTSCCACTFMDGDDEDAYGIAEAQDEERRCRAAMLAARKRVETRKRKRQEQEQIDAQNAAAEKAAKKNALGFISDSILGPFWATTGS